MFLNSLHDGSSCTSYEVTWEVPNDRLEIDCFLRVSFIQLIHLNKDLFASIVTEALEQPFNCRLKQREILFMCEFRVAILDCIVVVLVYELHHDHQVFFLVRVDAVPYSSQIGASVGSTEWFCDTSNHFRETQEI